MIMKLVSLPILLSLSTSIMAYINGRCSGNWNHGVCICIDHDECLNTYGGVAFSGSPGDYPCPYDPNNIIGCYITPCPGQGYYTKCTWSDGCSIINGRRLSGRLAALHQFHRKSCWS